MSIIAEMALRRARGRLNSVQSRASAKAPASTPVPPRPNLDQVEVSASGPINRLMFVEGRAWAIELVRSLRESPAAVVIDRLARAAAGRPGSYVAGIQSVITELKEADLTGQHEDGSLNSQAGRTE